MKPTIWLASYPKSGNTWLRMMLDGLKAPDGERLDINKPRERVGIASARLPFDRVTLIDSDILTPKEIDRLRPAVHAELMRDAVDDSPEDNSELDGGPQLPVRFVKVHDAYTQSPSGEPLLAGALGASGAVLITRDPRDVVCSVANHFGLGIDAATVFLNNEKAKIAASRTQFRQILLSWSGFAASWLDQTDIPVLPLRYEEMKRDPAAALASVLRFAKVDMPPESVRRAVARADFNELQRQERQLGFAEAAKHKEYAGFFRRGEAGAWRKELTAAQVRCIEVAHQEMMQRLGY